MVLKIQSLSPNLVIHCPFLLRQKRSLGLFLVAGVMGILLYHPIRAYGGLKPKAIFVLGGHEERERLAAKMAQSNPSLPIWVSSGSPEGYVKRIFTHAGVSSDRLHLDYRAKDTVTNFTTVVDDLKARGITSVYLVTSSSHMPRAYVIGEIVFGSRGIEIKPVAVPSHSPPESWDKSLRDGARAILWVFTGYSGEIFKHHR